MFIISNTNFTLSTTLHHAATKAIRKAGSHIPDTVTGSIKYSTTHNVKYHPDLKSFLATETQNQSSIKASKGDSQGYRTSN